MNFLLLGSAVLVLAFVFLMAKKSLKPASGSVLTAAEAKRRLDGEPGIVLLDVRNPEEYREKHLPGSILIPLHQLAKEVQQKIPVKSSPVFVYCLRGTRSAKAAEILGALGYTQVFQLGGIAKWPYETESGS
jgi:phage shock protein E